MFLRGSRYGSLEVRCPLSRIGFDHPEMRPKVVVLAQDALVLRLVHPSAQLIYASLQELLGLLRFPAPTSCQFELTVTFLKPPLEPLHLAHPEPSGESFCNTTEGTAEPYEDNFEPGSEVVVKKDEHGCKEK